MGRRYTGDEIERIPAGGDWAEWFDVRTTLAIGDTAKIEREFGGIEKALSSDPIGAVGTVAAMMIVQWSLPKPITQGEFMRLPVDMVTPVIQAVVRFLLQAQQALQSPTPTSKNLQPSTADSLSQITATPTL